MHKKPITVLTLVYSLPPFKTGGAESQALKLSKQLQQRNITTLLVTVGDKKLKGWGELEGVPVYRVYNLWDYVKNFFKPFLVTVQPNAKNIRPATQIEFDDTRETTTKVVTPVTFSTRVRYISFFFSSFIVLFKKRKEINIIYVPSLEWTALTGLWLSKLFKIPLILKDSTMNGITNILRYPNGRNKQRNIIAQANFVAISKAIISNLKKEGVPENKIRHIPNGIEIKDFFQNSLSTDPIKRILFVGNLTQQPAKGVDILLKAWKIVTSKRNNIHLDIVGEGDIFSYNRFVNEIGISKTVTFYGKQDVEKFFLKAYLFVLPSRREGLSNALLEAMMHGLPCIATDISGNQDLIENKSNGILVPPFNIENLAEAIVYLLDNSEEAKKMGLLARQTVIDRCSFDIVSAQYENLYHELLSDTG